MTITMYQASVPAFVHSLQVLSTLLDKAEAHCTAKKIDPAVMIGARLIADMLPLSRQIQIACDGAKGCVARLAGSDIPSWPDDEKSFADLKARIKKTIDYAQSFKAGQIDGSASKAMQGLKMGGQTANINGMNYLNHFVLPNFYFHIATAYAIMRANGVEVGKKDFLGAVPGLKMG